MCSITNISKIKQTERQSGVSVYSFTGLGGIDQ